MADFAGAVVSTVVGDLVASVRRQCGYVISSSSYLRQLQDEVENLENARDRVQHSIEEARNNKKQIKASVERWAYDVEAVTYEAREVLEHGRRAENTYFCGWLPNPKTRHHLGREARRTVEDIQELIARSQFEDVYYENAPPEHLASAPDVNSSIGDQGLTIIKSRASILEDIMNALDDETLKVIGVYGPGGVGKTTLLEEVEKKLKNDNRLFHIIAKAEVSQTPELKNIQDDIAYALGLNLNDLQSEVERRKRLFRRLQRDPTRKVLIIFDDLWGALDLKAIGIPLGEESKGCKLLLTSRYKDVLEQKMHADKTFHHKGLKEDEAFGLFEKTVGDKLKDNEELKAIAAQLVKKIGGLPLYIIYIANTLKYGDVSAWRNGLTKIEDSYMETIVKLRYDHLEFDDAKSLFLLCGLIGGTIEVELLLILGMGVGLFEGFDNTIQDSRDRLHTMLDSLRSACLLLDRGDDRESVTIHNLYSEVIVSTPFRGQNFSMTNSNYGSWPKEKLEKCAAICLADVGRDGLAELISCQFPDLKILMLSQAQGMGDCSRLDFTCMRELRVLYLRSMHITRLPSSIEILGNLQSLYLDRCNVMDVAILGKLKALQILSFAGSAISRLPKEIGELTNLRSLNLNNCHKLLIIEAGALEGLINLEELCMKGSFDRWMGEDEIPLESSNARLAELKSMTKLATLEISIPDPTILPSFENLIRFWIKIGNVDGRKFEGLRTMVLKSRECNNILSREWVQKTLQKTQYLYLNGLREFKKNANELCTQGFVELKHLDIQNSPSIEYIANSSNGHPPTGFMIVESLFLRNLINLEKICHGPVSAEWFSKLKAVNVTKCNRLKNLWSISEVKTLVHLEEIQVCECDSMRAIVTDDAGENKVAVDEIVKLPSVRRLKLDYLPHMASFCTKSEINSKGAPIQVSFPRLESLVMAFLDQEKILYSQPPLKYSNLRSLEISESPSPSSILKSDWILKLPNLESLCIQYCRSAVVAFELEEQKVTGDVEILSRLTTLTLWVLLNLQRMWKQDAQLQGISRFRNLKKLSVGYTRMAFLFPVSVAKCLREITEIEVKNCRDMEAVIVDEEGRGDGTDEIIEFPLLKRLHISRCPTKKFISYPHGKKESETTAANSQDAYCDSFFDQKVSLPILESLELHLVGSFKRIWPGELPRSSFCELATLTLGYCSDLLDIFPSTIIGRLQNLKRVTIEECPSLESLFVCGSINSNAEKKVILLPKLEVVDVREAGRLRHMVKSDFQMVLGFPSLINVNVNNCSELRCLFSNCEAAALEKLESPHFSHCEQMEGVATKEEGSQSKAQVMSFPCLRDLRILECRNFGAFIGSPASVERPLGEITEEE